MQRITLVRYTTRPETSAQNETLSRAVFAELKKERPKDVIYSLFRNGDEFVHLFVNLATTDASPVTELPTFKAFQKDSQVRFTAPPEVTRLDINLVDSYGLPGR